MRAADDLREAFEMGLIDREMISELRLGHCSVFGFPGKNSGELITTMEAYKLGMITEDSAVRVLSIQVIKSIIDNIELSKYIKYIVTIGRRPIVTIYFMYFDSSIIVKKGEVYS